MKYWTVHPETKEVIGEWKADKWNVPRNVLLKEPLPNKNGFAVIALEDMSGTEYIEDNRDKVMYDTTNPSNSALVVELGSIKDGWTLDEPLPFSIWLHDKWVQQIELVRQSKKDEINAWRNTLENDDQQTVLAVGGEWDAGPDARLRIDSALLTEQMPPYWTDANNVVHHGMTLDELKQVKVAISDLGFAIHDRQRNMKKEVEALTELDEILNYSVGWPEE